MKLREAFQIKKDMYANLDDVDYGMKVFQKLPIDIQHEVNTRITDTKSALKHFENVLPKYEADADKHPDDNIRQNLATSLEQKIAYIKDTSGEWSKYFYILNDISTDPADDKVIFLRQAIMKRLIQKLTMLVQINQYHNYKNLHGIFDVLHRELNYAVKALKNHNDANETFEKVPFIFMLSDTIPDKYFMPLAKDDLSRFADTLNSMKKDNIDFDDVKDGYDTDKKTVDDNRKGYYLVPPVGEGDMGDAISGAPLCPESLRAKSNKDVINKLEGTYKDSKKYDNFENVMEEIDYNDDASHTELPIDFRTKWTGNFYNCVYDPNEFKNTSDDYKKDVYKIID